MEEDDDDFYGSRSAQHAADHAPARAEDEQVDMTVEQNEDEDSDDDVEFTLEKQDSAKENSSAPSKKSTTLTQPSSNELTRNKTQIKSNRQDTQRGTSPSITSTTVKSPLLYHGKEGKDFPDVRTSKIDVNSVPIWPNSNKLITEIDIDADLAGHSKPWRLPGVDLTDYYNYGFDEYSWAQYCMRQQTMVNNLNEAKQADAQMKAFLGGGGASVGMPGMPGLQDMDPQMAQMMQESMANGMPSLDHFMQMMGGAAGMPPNQGGGAFTGNFGLGPGQNSGSPHPQSGQGFQPPSIPAGGLQSGMGMPENMDGYSPQQIAIMQQQGGGGGGGRRGGRGRGRGYY